MLRALLALIACLGFASGARAEERLLVFAAASLKTALDEVDASFQARTRASVVVSYAASSALARQIERGAPADVFISADLDWMDYLEKKNLLRPGTRRNLLGNRLVWIVPAAAAAPGRPLDALGASGRLALADPRHVPAGKYAREALEKLGWWTRVARRLAAAENVRAALALVARAEAPLGIVYRTDAEAEPKVRVAGAIDPTLHNPIVYPAALLRGAKPAAAAYFEFLFTPEARAIFAKHGFSAP